MEYLGARAKELGFGKTAAIQRRNPLEKVKAQIVNAQRIRESSALRKRKGKSLFKNLKNEKRV